MDSVTFANASCPASAGLVRPTDGFKAIYMIIGAVLHVLFVGYLSARYLRGKKKQFITVSNELYAQLDSRFESYRNCTFNFCQPICSLCEAGFYYIGNGETDGVACFSCNIHLRNWTNSDTPWVQHARWSKDCSYLLLCKGKSFVQEVQNAYNVEANSVEELIAEDEDTDVMADVNQIEPEFGPHIDAIQLENINMLFNFQDQDLNNDIYQLIAEDEDTDVVADVNQMEPEFGPRVDAIQLENINLLFNYQDQDLNNDIYQD